MEKQRINKYKTNKQNKQNSYDIKTNKEQKQPTERDIFYVNGFKNCLKACSLG